jgi:hypothetical protein
LALATEDREVVAAYLPVGGAVELTLPTGKRYQARWFDPRTGDLQAAGMSEADGRRRFVAPPGQDEQGHPWDWVLVADSR